ncbi:MAG: type IV secretion system protein [Candidatus Pacebacteria bacterium]|nr:type IV secretion system protein [Candidatus Paceibacterota bacterium]
MEKRKSTIFKILILVLLLGALLLPFYFVEAMIPGLDIATAPFVWTAKQITKLYTGVLLSFFALRTSLAILSWVISPNFTQIPGGFTHNLFVLEGWRIIRDLVNMLFILVVIIIGLGIALRVREYEIQKTAPRLIAMALLINFTPVICGVIIDASNIIMNFFLGAGGQGLGRLVQIVESPLKTIAGALATVIGGLFRGDIGGIIFGLFFRPLMIIIFNAFATFIILLLAALLVARHLVLWMLVILAPLAFFCNILPTTKRIWNMWWKQFIQWCFVGIGASFFLYLTQRMIELRHLFWTHVPEAEIGLASGVFLAALPLGFLAIGYFATTAFAPMGAQQVIGVVKRGAKWPTTKKGRRWLEKKWGRAKRRVKGEISRVGRRPTVATRIGKLEEKGKAWSVTGKKEGGVKGTLKRVAGWGMRKMAELPEAATVVYPKTEYAEWAKVGEKIRDEKTFRDELYSWRKERTNKARLVGLISGAIKSGNLKDFIKAGAVSEKTIEDAFRWASRYKLKDAQKSLQKYFASDEDMLMRFANVLDQETANLPAGHKDKTTGGLTDQDRAKGYTSYVEKVRTSVLRTRKDFEDLWDRIEDLPEARQSQAKKNAIEQITEMIHKGLLDREQLAHAGRVIGEEFVSTFENKVKENLEQDKLFYHKIDPRTKRSRAWIIRWLATSPVARELGMWLPEELQKKETRDHFENISKLAESRVRQTTLPEYRDIIKAKTPRQIEALLEKTLTGPLAELHRDIWKAKREKDTEKQQILESSFNAILQKLEDLIQQIKTKKEARAIRTYIIRARDSFSRPSRARQILLNAEREITQKLNTLP